MRPEEIVRRARARVGVPFRPQGRDPESGLDCIGLVADAVGKPGAARDYALRGGSLARLEAALRSAGLERAGAPAAGDVLVCVPGAEQLHLGIWTGTGLVHADVSLRRVVERPGAPPWPVAGVWRMREG